MIFNLGVISLTLSLAGGVKFTPPPTFSYVYKKPIGFKNRHSLTFPKYKFWTRFTKKKNFTRHMGGRIGSPKMTFKKSGYIKIVQFELVLPVLHNFFNFWDKITKPGNYWDYISFYNSQKLLSFWIYTFYRIEIWNRANFMIFGPFSAFGAPKEGQIFIFDKCVFYNF